MTPEQRRLCWGKNSERLQEGLQEQPAGKAEKEGIPGAEAVHAKAPEGVGEGGMHPLFYSGI